eukprot:9113579-Pyramimonas_sp.AAC.1
MNGHPPRIPWDGQRAAAANAIAQLVGSKGKFQEEWITFSAALDCQRGQDPWLQPMETLHRFLSLRKDDLARGTLGYLAGEHSARNSNEARGRSPAAAWHKRPPASDGHASRDDLSQQPPGATDAAKE